MPIVSILIADKSQMLVGVSVFFVQWRRAASMMQISLLERFATSVGAQHTDTLVVTHKDDLLTQR